MSEQPLNLRNFENFISKVSNADATKQREIRLDIDNAKMIAYTMGQVVSRLAQSVYDMEENQTKSQSVTVTMDGGNRW